MEWGDTAGWLAEEDNAIEPSLSGGGGRVQGTRIALGQAASGAVCLGAGKDRVPEAYVVVVHGRRRGRRLRVRAMLKLNNGRTAVSPLRGSGAVGAEAYLEGIDSSRWAAAVAAAASMGTVWRSQGGRVRWSFFVFFERSWFLIRRASREGVSGRNESSRRRGGEPGNNDTPGERRRRRRSDAVAVAVAVAGGLDVGWSRASRGRRGRRRGRHPSWRRRRGGLKRSRARGGEQEELDLVAMAEQEAAERSRRGEERRGKEGARVGRCRRKAPTYIWQLGRWARLEGALLLLLLGPRPI